MKTIVINSILAAIVFISMAVALCVWWYGLSPNRPMFRPYPAHTLELVRTASNIEHLRKFTQQLIWGNEAVGKRTNETLDFAVNVIAGLSMMCALISLLGMGYAFKVRNEALGIPLKWWLRWF